LRAFVGQVSVTAAWHVEKELQSGLLVERAVRREVTLVVLSLGHAATFFTSSVDFLTISRVDSVRLCLKACYLSNQHFWLSSRCCFATDKLVRRPGPSCFVPSLSTSRCIPSTLLCILKICIATLSLSFVNALSSPTDPKEGDVQSYAK
jgi:hypothetical protein